MCYWGVLLLDNLIRPLGKTGSYCLYTLHGDKWDVFSLRTLRPLRLKKGVTAKDAKSNLIPFSVYSISLNEYEHEIR